MQEKTLQCQMNLGSWAKRYEQLRVETDKAQAEMEDNGQPTQAESLVEAELDLESRGIAGRRGKKR